MEWSDIDVEKLKEKFIEVARQCGSKDSDEELSQFVDACTIKGGDEMKELEVNDRIDQVVNEKRSKIDLDNELLKRRFIEICRKDGSTKSDEELSRFVDQCTTKSE